MNATSQESKSESVEFYNQLSTSIADGFKNILGEGGMQTLLFYLQFFELAKDPKGFHEKLSQIFKEGALTLERIIVKELFWRLNLPYRESEDFDFEKYVNLAKEISLTRRLPEGGGR